MPSILPSESSPLSYHMENAPQARYVDASEFRRLIVSTRRMERVDQFAPKMRGLRDLETGELFLVDERRLLDGKR